MTPDRLTPETMLPPSPALLRATDPERPAAKAVQLACADAWEEDIRARDEYARLWHRDVALWEQREGVLSNLQDTVNEQASILAALQGREEPK